MAPSTDSANLARIRDNQRRSRARRKEYVQELESRLRKVELQGVEAAAEIQHAARAVIEENRMLRSLLRRHGVPDEAIDSYLYVAGSPTGTGVGVGVGVGAETGSPSSLGRGGGSLAGRSGNGGAGPGGGNGPGGGMGAAVTGRAAKALEQLLVPRRPSCPSLSVPLPSPGAHSRSSREPSVTSDSTAWDPAQQSSTTAESPMSGTIAVSPVPSTSQQLSSVSVRPTPANIGQYSLGGPGTASGQQGYDMEYQTPMSIPYVQMQNQQYDAVPLNYYPVSRGYSQGQY